MGQMNRAEGRREMEELRTFIRPDAKWTSTAFEVDFQYGAKRPASVCKKRRSRRRRVAPSAGRDTLHRNTPRTAGQDQ